MSRVLIRNGTIVTLNKNRDVLNGDLLIEDNKIVRIAPQIFLRDNKPIDIVDATGQFVIPGFVQAHTHLVQTLFRGYADDLPLLDWLKQKIWPMEYYHDKESISSSAQVSLLEMQLLGTTSILDMATVNHTEHVFEQVEKSGMRYWGGKCLMDLKGSSGPLYQNTKDSLSETIDLITNWHLRTDLINYAICPRFVISCSEKILKQSKELQDQFGLIIHTHASESKEEIAVVKKRTGKGNIDYINYLGLLNPKTVIVHGVHMTKAELNKMVKTGTPLVHCPSSNLKLASGIAPIELYDLEGLTMGIGADGAPCNNTMDPFMEMRLTALLQKPKYGPEAMPAQRAFELATLGGAEVLGYADQIGSLEEGKLADVVTVDRSHPSVSTVENPYSALVYSCSGRDVTNVFINGKSIVRNKVHQIFESEAVLTEAKVQLNKLLKRL